MTTQQKIWKVLCILGWASRPLLLYLLLPAALTSLGMRLRGVRQTTEEFVAVSGNFYHTLGIILVFYLLFRSCRRRGESFFDEATLYVRNLDKKKMFLLIGTGVGLSLALSAVITLIPFPGFLADQYTSSTSNVYGGGDMLLAMLSTLILAPVVEEIIFRGYMLNRLMRGFTKRTAVWVCSWIFALCHVTPLWVAYALVMGLMLADISIREDNIAYAIGLHLGFNLTSVPSWFINNSPGASALFYKSPLLIACYGIIGACLALWLYRSYNGRSAYD